MNIKDTLKSLKLNESTISMILGAIVIIVVGVLVINYFRGQDNNIDIPALITEEETSLPTTYTVKSGDDLWKISERFYATGYNWVDIADANNLSQPGQIEEGQELSIPDVKPRLAEAISQVTLSPVPTAKPSATNIPTPTVAEKEDTAAQDTVIKTDAPISQDTYTVVRGDTLWDIAIRAYGDGYKWVEIARANDLANPDLIHAGNVFTLPR